MHQVTLCLTFERRKRAEISRNADPRLTGTGRIFSTAAVAVIGASTPGQLIIGFIAKELIRASST
jgi:hypothetical protein